MRADKFFAERFGSRTKASDALKRGLVCLGGKPLSPDYDVRGDEPFSFPEPGKRFVSEGGYKLERGLESFGESVAGCVFADLGASTGGFTDCLLQRGAKRVFAVDVGQRQLAPSLAEDGRVTVMDSTNARYLGRDDFPCALDGVVSDLSFISLRTILPAVERLLPEEGRAFLLFKPQFECGKGRLGKSGICPVRLHEELLSEFYDFACSLALAPRGVVPAPIRPKKNIEYMLFLSRGEGIPKWEFLSRAIPAL